MLVSVGVRKILLLCSGGKAHTISVLAKMPQCLGYRLFSQPLFLLVIHAFQKLMIELWPGNTSGAQDYVN